MNISVGFTIGNSTFFKHDGVVKISLNIFYLKYMDIFCHF